MLGPWGFSNAKQNITSKALYSLLNEQNQNRQKSHAI